MSGEWSSWVYVCNNNQIWYIHKSYSQAKAGFPYFRKLKRIDLNKADLTGWVVLFNHLLFENTHTHTYKHKDRDTHRNTHTQRDLGRFCTSFSHQGSAVNQTFLWKYKNQIWLRSKGEIKRRKLTNLFLKDLNFWSLEFFIP